LWKLNEINEFGKRPKKKPQKSSNTPCMQGVSKLQNTDITIKLTEFHYVWKTWFDPFKLKVKQQVVYPACTSCIFKYIGVYTLQIKHDYLIVLYYSSWIHVLCLSMISCSTLRFSCYTATGCCRYRTKPKKHMLFEPKVSKST